MLKINFAIVLLDTIFPNNLITQYGNQIMPNKIDYDKNNSISLETITVRYIPRLIANLSLDTRRSN